MFGTKHDSFNFRVMLLIRVSQKFFGSQLIIELVWFFKLLQQRL